MMLGKKKQRFQKRDRSQPQIKFKKEGLLDKLKTR